MDGAEQIYNGQCQCGAVRYTVRTALDSLMDCNCSRCRRVGWVMQPVPATAFTLLSGEGDLTLFQFNTDRIDHLFCRTCGIESFARGTDGSGAETVMVNVNCLEPPVPIDRTAIHHWDGASL
jgi:hypothetical protein